MRSACAHLSMKTSLACTKDPDQKGFLPRRNLRRIRCASLTPSLFSRSGMATKRSTFQKRQRETDLKDKALAKQRRRADKRNQQGGPIERGPDGLPLNTGSDDTGASDGTASPTANAAPPPPPQNQGYRPQRGPGPRGMNPGPRMPSPSPTPVAPPSPPPVPAKTGPSPMYVPSKHLTNKPRPTTPRPTTTPPPTTTTTPTTTTQQSSADAPKPASTTPPSSTGTRR